MKKYFDLARAGGVLLVAVFALFVFSCSEKPESQPVDTGHEAEVALAEAAGKAHNRALDILLHKLKAAEHSATRSEGDEEPIDDSEPSQVRALLVQAIVLGMQEMPFASEYPAMWSELRNYMNYCNENPNAEGELINWSTMGQDYLDSFSNIARTYYPDADAAAAAIDRTRYMAKWDLSEAEYNDLSIATNIMKYSFQYWYANYNNWFPEQSNYKWRIVTQADCEWAIGVLAGTAQFCEGGWITNVMGQLSYNSKIAVTCACATAGSMIEALRDYQDEFGAYWIDETLVDSLQYSFSYGVALEALQALGLHDDSWDDAGNTGGIDEP